MVAGRRVRAVVPRSRIIQAEHCGNGVVVDRQKLVEKEQ